MLQEHRVGAILSDGTTIDELVDEQELSVVARVMNDPELYDLELKKLFSREWLFVGHESEIPDKGDYVARRMGEDPVIVTRARDGQIHVLLNICSHRGAQVCQAECGNATTFQCPYHGWIYDGTGRLLGVTAEREALGDRLDKSQYGLQEARVGVYHGMIFANWDQAAPSLEERFATMGFYYDMLFGLTDGGLEVTGPPLRWVENTNWKFASDNLVGDGYHTMSVHKSMDQLGLVPGFADPTLTQNVTSVFDEATGDGLENFGIFPVDDSSEEAAWEQATFWMGLTEDFAEQARRRLSASQAEVFLKGMPGVGNIFPNLGWLALPWPTGDPDEGMSYMLVIRLAEPYGPDQHMVSVWGLVARDLDPELKEMQRKTTVRMFGSSGMLEQDDAQIWSGTQKSIRGAQGRNRKLRYPLVKPRNEDWPGPGYARTSFPDEMNQMNFWRRWRDLLNG
jgi:phenylpropionate dioxygenase-like ring-hydroxylating dioxygenase large terminal subunit